MISNTPIKNGRIIFFRRDSMSRLKELKFTDAYCVAYAEMFNSNNEQPLQIQLTLSSRDVKLNNSTYQHPWPA